MAFNVSIKSNIRDVQKDLKLLGRAAPRILVQSMNRPLAGTRASMNKRMQLLLNLRNQKRLKRDSYIRRATLTNMSAAVGYRNTKRFNALASVKGAKWTKKGGVAFNSMGKTVRVKSGFSRYKNGVKIGLIRETRKPYPLRGIYTQVNAAQAVKRNPEPERQAYLTRFDKEINRRLTFELQKRGFK